MTVEMNMAMRDDMVTQSAQVVVSLTTYLCIGDILVVEHGVGRWSVFHISNPFQSGQFSTMRGAVLAAAMMNDAIDAIEEGKGE